jgi:urea transporter
MIDNCSTFQLAFVNNPLGGGIILAVIFATNWKIGIGSVLGGSIATVAEMVSNDVTTLP